MSNPTGVITMEARGKSWRLHLGMSVLADLQEKFGERFEAVFTPRKGGKMPDLAVVHAVFLGALQRYHEDEADRWLVDDLIAENQNAWGQLITASSPESDGQEAEAKGKKKAAG